MGRRRKLPDREKYTQSREYQRSLETFFRLFHIGNDAHYTAYGAKGEAKKVIVSKLAEKHKVSQRYIWRALKLGSLAAKFRASPYRTKISSRSNRLINARIFLINALRQGPRPRNHVVAAAAAAGITTRTLERAYSGVGVASSRECRSRLWGLSDETKRIFMIKE
jgi:hypothetical protein